MDSKSFDSLTRRFVTRRAGAGLALAGLLGLAVPGVEAKKHKKKKKCKTPCGLCATCKKGKCKANAGQKPCGAACIASNACCTNGTPGCPAGGTCTKGKCSGCAKVGGFCADGPDCCSGVCNTDSNECVCMPFGGRCKYDNWCCGGNCDKDPGDSEGVCGKGNPGTLCNAVFECINTCAVGVCT